MYVCVLGGGEEAFTLLLELMYPTDGTGYASIHICIAAVVESRSEPG